MSLLEQRCTNNVKHSSKRTSSPLEGPSLKRQKLRVDCSTNEASSHEGQIMYQPTAQMVPFTVNSQSNITVHFSCRFRDQKFKFHGPYHAWLYTQQALPAIACILNANRRDG